MGLGNPGPTYERTRHNVGAWAVCALAERHGAKLKAARAQRSLVAEVRFGAGLMVVAFPQTFMNDSGAAASSLVRRYGVSELLDRLVVVHDELDLPVGKVKVKQGGGTAGHNGLRSIGSHLGSLDFPRVRIGIGRPPGRMDGAAFVLGRPGASETKELQIAAQLAADAVEVLADDGVAAAMNRFNGG